MDSYDQRATNKNTSTINARAAPVCVGCDGRCGAGPAWRMVVGLLALEELAPSLKEGLKPGLPRPLVGRRNESEKGRRDEGAANSDGALHERAKHICCPLRSGKTVALSAILEENIVLKCILSLRAIFKVTKWSIGALQYSNLLALRSANCKLRMRNNVQNFRLKKFEPKKSFSKEFSFFFPKESI